jgi:hypothetical protein
VSLARLLTSIVLGVSLSAALGTAGVRAEATPAAPWSNAFARLELAGASPLGSPQSDRFHPGFQGVANGGVGWRWVDLKLTAHFQVLPPKGALSEEAAVVGGVGGGFRLKVPGELLRQTPFLDVDLLYARTATLDRFAYSLAIGVHFPIDDAHQFRLGPVLRFLHITNPDRPNFDDRDSYLLTAGVSLELGMYRPSARSSAIP